MEFKKTAAVSTSGVRVNGKRFVVIADAQGRTIREHPQYESVWDVNFAPDGKLAGYGGEDSRLFPLA